VRPQLPPLQVPEPEPTTGGSAQTWPQVPQLAGSLARVSHPLVHIVSPARQALQSVPAVLQALGQVVVVVTQAWLALHISAEVLMPLVHDCAAPHSVPTGLLVVAAQTDVPVAHDVLPFLHGLVGEQVSPAVQETQPPVLQTMFVPHVAPSASEVPASVQVALPVWQDNVPL
jgi:hypothetical protein